jgi:tetratricopeptide (TPR) repeat protein
LGAFGVTVRAEDPEGLVQARAHLEEARFDAALQALEQAIASGKASRENLSEIYRLIGETSVALGKGQEAQSAFQSLLSLDPEVQLGEMVSPKIKEELELARLALDGAKLEIEHEVKEYRVTLSVKSDPLEMAAGLQLAYARDDGSTASMALKLQEDGTAAVDVPEQARESIVLSVVDGSGNRLVAIPLPDRPKPIVAPEPKPEPPSSPERPLLKKWWLWAGVSGAFALSGGVFGLMSSSAQSDLDAILDTPGDHFYSDATEAEDRARRFALTANIGYGLAGASAIVASYFFFTQKSGPSNVEVALTAAPGGAGATLKVSF